MMHMQAHEVKEKVQPIAKNPENQVMFHVQKHYFLNMRKETK